MKLPNPEEKVWGFWVWGLWLWVEGSGSMVYEALSRSRLGSQDYRVLHA